MRGFSDSDRNSNNYSLYLLLLGFIKTTNTRDNHWEDMAAVGVESMRPESAMEETCNVKIAAAKQGEGLKQYYLQHIHELQRQLRQKTNNLNRLEAQRNELNSRGPFFFRFSILWIWVLLKMWFLAARSYLLIQILWFCLTAICASRITYSLWFIV